MLKDRIAIVGVGCRFPGGINHPDAFWKLLAEGREAVSDVPADRWNVKRFYDAEPGILGKSIARRGGFVDGIDQFDRQFFSISPREAPYVDPQHRLLLETAWEAIEDAGLVLDFEKGTDLGVFVGISHNDYQVIQGTPWDSHGVSPHSPTGTAHSIAANRMLFRPYRRLRGVRTHSHGPRRYRTCGRRDGDDHARRFHRFLAGVDAFA